MKLDPVEAIKNYEDAERAARDAYEQFWITRFGLAGIHFKPAGTNPSLRFYGHGLVAEDGKFALTLHVSPSWFNGARVEVYQDVAPDGHAKDYRWAGSSKPRSESGINRFIARLRNKGYQTTLSLI